MKRLATFAAAAMLLCAPVPEYAAAAPQVGSVIGSAVKTDIRVFIGGKAIPSLNLNGRTAVVAEQLRHYGFDVGWNAAKKRLSVVEAPGKPIDGDASLDRMLPLAGGAGYDILYSDIEVRLNGSPIESFNLNGQTAVYLDALAPLGTLNWNESERTATFEFAGKAGQPGSAPRTEPVSVRAVWVRDVVATFEERDGGAFAGDRAIGTVNGDDEWVSVAYLAESFGYRVTGPNGNGALYAENEDGYGFELSHLPVAALYWQGKKMRTVALSRQAAELDGIGAAMLVRDAENVFGFRMRGGPEARQLVYPQYETEDWGVPETVDGDVLNVNGEVVMYAETKESVTPYVTLYHSDYVQGEAGGSRGLVLGGKAPVDGELTYSAGASLPLFPGTNAVQSLVQMNSRIIMAKEQPVEAHIERMKLDVSQAKDPMVRFSEVELTSPQQGFVAAKDGAVDIRGTVKNAVGDELSIVAEKLRGEREYAVVSQQAVPIGTGKLLSARLQLPGGPGLYRVRLISSEYVHHGGEVRKEIARFYAAVEPSSAGAVTAGGQPAEIPQPCLAPDKLQLPPAGSASGVEQAASTAPAIDKQQAEAIAAAEAPIPPGYTAVGAEFSRRPLYLDGINRRRIDPFHEGPGQWRITFAGQGETDPVWQTMVDGQTGKLGWFYKEASQEAATPRISREEAKRIADAFIDRLNGDVRSELLQYDDSQGGLNGGSESPQPFYGYRIRYDRVAYGVRFPDNNILLTIDGEGNIVSYNYNWDMNVVFENPACSIGAEAAEQSFRSGISLVYNQAYERPDSPQRLVYDFGPLRQLEGVTGRVVDHAYQLVTDNAVSDKPVAEGPLASAPPRRDVPLSGEEAVQTARAMSGLPADLEPQSAENVNGVWIVRFSTTVETASGEKGAAYDIIVHERTGKLAFYRYGEATDRQTPAVSVIRAQEAAEQFLKERLPYAVHDMHLANNLSYSVDGNRLLPSYSFTYVRIVGGAKLGQVTIIVNGMTGNVESYQDNYAAYDDPQPTAPAITLQDATSKVFGRNRLELVYAVPDEARCPSGDYVESIVCAEQTVERKTARLMYRWISYLGMDQLVMDAQTGNWIVRRNGEDEPSSASPRE